MHVVWHYDELMHQHFLLVPIALKNIRKEAGHAIRLKDERFVIRINGHEVTGPDKHLRIIALRQYRVCDLRSLISERKGFDIPYWELLHDNRQ